MRSISGKKCSSLGLRATDWGQSKLQMVVGNHNTSRADRTVAGKVGSLVRKGGDQTREAEPIFLASRDGRIRTAGLLLPKQAR